MRSPSSRLVAVLAFALALCIGLASCSKGGGTGPQPAATVAGTKITDSQVAKSAQLFTFLAGLNRSQCGTIVAGETQAQACNRFALSNLIQNVFVVNYAAQHQIAVTEADITSVLAQLDQGVGASTVDQALASNHLTRDDLHGLAQQVLLFQKVEEDLAAAKSNDADLHQLYQQQILSFTTVTAEHILVKTEAEAQQIYDEVTKPGATNSDFQAQAKAHSIDKQSAKKGGSLGTTQASKFVAPFAKAVAALQPGEISKPVHTQFGWHVIKLIDKKVTPYAQAKSQLLQSQGPSVFNAWLTQQATTQSVDVNPSFGRYELSSLSVVPVTSTNPSDTATPPASAAASATP